MKNKYLIILLTLLFLNTDAQTTSWTLEYCIEKSLKDNIHIKRLSLNQENALANSQQSYVQLLPTINASANHSYNFGRNINPVTNTFQESNIQGNQFSINVGLQIFNGLQTQFRIKEMQSEYQASKEEIEQSKYDVILSITSAYLQILFNTQLLKASQWQIENLKVKKNQIEKAIEAGTMTKSQLLEVQTLLATDEYNATSVENSLELSKLNLLQIMLLPSYTDFELADSNLELVEATSIENTDEIFASASKTLPAPKRAQLLMQSAKFREYSAKNNRLPKLSLYGGVISNYAQILGQSNQFGFQDQLKNNFGQYVQLRLDIPILNSWQSRTSIQTSIINRKNAELNVVEIQNNLRNDIEKANFNKIAASKKYIASQKQIDVMRENFRMAEQKLAVGTISLSDFGILKNRLYSAESDYLRAKYDFKFKSKILNLYKNTAP